MSVQTDRAEKSCLTKSSTPKDTLDKDISVKKRMKLSFTKTYQPL